MVVISFIRIQWRAADAQLAWQMMQEETFQADRPCQKRNFFFSQQFLSEKELQAQEQEAFAHGASVQGHEGGKRKHHVLLKFSCFDDAGDDLFHKVGFLAAMGFGPL